jgi:hypothetical protein
MPMKEPQGLLKFRKPHKSREVMAWQGGFKG